MKPAESNHPTSIFEQIQALDEQGTPFWGARRLAKALEYSDFRNFLAVIAKAKEACKNSGQAVEDHLVDFTEMVTIGSGAERSMDSVTLSRYGCYLIALQADASKPMVPKATEFFSTTSQEMQTADIQYEGNLIFYTSPQGNTRIDLSFDGETFWISQKKMAELFDVEVSTINYHLSQIFDSGELNRYAVIRKILIPAADGKSYR